MYSGLHQSKESGDLDGVEVMIIPANESYKSKYIAIVQIAEGSAPFVGIVELELEGNKIRFDLPLNSSRPGEHVEGVFVGKYLTIKFVDGSDARLIKGRSFWN